MTGHADLIARLEAAAEGSRERRHQQPNGRTNSAWGDLVMTPSDLIGLLEAAIAPDPHLDAEIEAIIRGGVPAYRCSDSTRRSYGPSVVFRVDDGSNIMEGDWYSAPSFSGSLDAALPGERIVMMSIQRPRPGQPPKWCAKNDGAREVGYGWTEVLARRIAALKARTTT
jgi:hypothetical protein